MASVGTLEDEARKRKERLRNLKRKEPDTQNDKGSNNNEKLPKWACITKFRIVFTIDYYQLMQILSFVVILFLAHHAQGELEWLTN